MGDGQNSRCLVRQRYSIILGMSILSLNTSQTILEHILLPSPATIDQAAILYATQGKSISAVVGLIL